MADDVTADGIEESDLHAFLDGELDPARDAKVRAYLMDNPDAHERLARSREHEGEHRQDARADDRQHAGEVREG